MLAEVQARQEAADTRAQAADRQLVRALAVPPQRTTFDDSPRRARPLGQAPTAGDAFDETETRPKRRRRARGRHL